MKHSEYVEIVKGLGRDALKKALLNGAVKQLPFLALGPMNILTVKLVAWLSELAVEEAEMRVFFEYIDFRTSAQAKDFESAMIKNHTIQQIGTDEQKKLAEAELAEALNKLVSLNR